MRAQITSRIPTRSLVRHPGAARSVRQARGKQLLEAFRHPALWLSLAVILNVLEGAVRKWVPGFGEGLGRGIMYFSKDAVFLAGVGLLFFRNAKRRPAMESLNHLGASALALILCGGALSTVFDFNAVGSFLSLRAIVILPLAAWFYATRVGRFPLTGFATIVIVLALINTPLALMQSGLPKDHLLNRYAASEVEAIELAHGVRATGTFAYITGLGVVSSLGVWAGLVVLGLARSGGQQLLGAVGILCGFGCAFASGSRGTFVTAAVMLACWMLSSVKAFRMVWSGTWMAAVTALGFLLVLPGLSDRFQIMALGTFDRFESAGDNNIQRSFGQWEEMWQALTTHPVGSGLGTEQVGGNFATKGQAMFTTYETQFPRIVAEFGVLGLAGYFLMVAAILHALQLTRNPRHASWNLVVTATQVYLLGQFYGNVVFNHTGSAAVWIVVAGVFAAAPISKRRKKGSSREGVRQVATRHVEEAAV